MKPFKFWGFSSIGNIQFLTKFEAVYPRETHIIMEVSLNARSDLRGQPLKVSENITKRKILHNITSDQSKNNHVLDNRLFLSVVEMVGRIVLYGFSIKL